MNVLIACEESQTVCKAFRELGHEAYSCDILECSGGHPEWHIIGNVLDLLKPKYFDFPCSGDVNDMDGEYGIEFYTSDYEYHYIPGKWDLLIAHPPCTFLTNVANRHHSLKTATLENINFRTLKRIFSMRFFMMFVNADCDHIAIENPVGVMNTCYRKPDQIIHPYMFAESVEDTENYVTKATCLWLKGLEPLETNHLLKPDNRELYGIAPCGKIYTWEERVSAAGSSRSKVRSKTFPGIAKAMAEQWGGMNHHERNE